MIVYGDRCWCARSSKAAEQMGLPACANEKCDRFITDAHRERAFLRELDFDLADLMTSKCGFVPLEGE